MTKRIQEPRIEFSTLFNKQLKKAPREIKISFRNTLELFLDDPENTYLRIHLLTEEYTGYNSIDVTEDWRAIFIETVDKEGNKAIVFKLIGTHNQLYKR